MRAPHSPSLSALVRAIRDPVVATIAATSAYACLLLVAGGGGRVVEMFVLGAVVIGAYALPTAPRYLALLAGAAYLTVELAEGRLSYDHYWTHVVAGVLLGGAVLAAAAARRARSNRIAETERAIALAGALRHEDELERLLGGERRLSPLERELLRSKRHDRSAGMLLIRPDGLDDATDPLRAHELLRQVATHVGRGLRTSDVAFRQGRFDICILLPETEPAGARAAGERLRLALLQEGAPSVSIGAATFPSTASHELLLARAEEALAQARQLGGNRTVASALSLDAPRAWQLAEPPQATVVDRRR